MSNRLLMVFSRQVAQVRLDSPVSLAHQDQKETLDFLGLDSLDHQA